MFSWKGPDNWSSSLSQGGGGKCMNTVGRGYRVDLDEMEDRPKMGGPCVDGD
jgi:hypothetical protein